MKCNKEGGSRMTLTVRVATIGVCICTAFSLSGATLASPSECQEAISQFNSALDDISSTLKRYATCVSNSQGHDDCSSEFRRLKSAQSDLEDAVSKYGSECN
jgi:hypothetical protein